MGSPTRSGTRTAFIRGRRRARALRTLQAYGAAYSMRLRRRTGFVTITPKRYWGAEQGRRLTMCPFSPSPTIALGRTVVNGVRSEAVEQSSSSKEDRCRQTDETERARQRWRRSPKSSEQCLENRCAACAPY